jgi:hypothetical protein
MRARISTVQHLAAALATLLSVVLLGCADTTAPPSKLFIADAGHAAIATLVDSNPSAGPLSIDRLISGNLTGLSVRLRGLSLDAAHDSLYAAVGDSVYAFSNVGTAYGNVTARRVFGVPSDSSFYSVFLDLAHDRLYVTSLTSDVKVINNASTATNASPARTITGDFGDLPLLFDAAVDIGRDILYVLVSSSSFGPPYAVAVFDGASSLNGAVSRSRAIVLNTQITNGSLYLDEANDRLYVSGAAGSIMIFETAHTRNGSVTADRFISVGPGDTKIAVDTANDRLYAISGSLGFIVNNISTANGKLEGVVVLAPAGSDLTAVAVSP